jgi:hypothetical protein
VGAGEARYLPIWKGFYPKADITAVEFSPVASERSAARYPFARPVVASAEELPSLTAPSTPLSRSKSLSTFRTEGA